MIEATDEEEDDEVIGRAAEVNFCGLADEVDEMREATCKEDFIWLVEEDAEDVDGIDVGSLVEVLSEGDAVTLVEGDEEEKIFRVVEIADEEIS